MSLFKLVDRIKKNGCANFGIACNICARIFKKTWGKAHRDQRPMCHSIYFGYMGTPAGIYSPVVCFACITPFPAAVRDTAACFAPLGEEMQRIMLRSKIHRVTVTQADLHYEGSCGIDQNLLDAADIREFEKIELYNINNGERFSTYAIKGRRGSGEISLNGAAARRAHLGDLLIICTYASMNETEVETYVPKIVFVDEKNQMTGLKK